MSGNQYTLDNDSMCLLSHWQWCYTRVGVCEAYRGGIDVCEGVLTAGADFVFITKNHGSQGNVSDFLKKKVPISLLTRNDDESFCFNLIQRVICHYYLIPCGTIGTRLPPSSICQEECSEVQSSCPAGWQTVQLGLKDYQFISCDNTAASLYPLPNCCTGAGIALPKNESTGCCLIIASCLPSLSFII